MTISSSLSSSALAKATPGDAKIPEIIAVPVVVCEYLNAEAKLELFELSHQRDQFLYGFLGIGAIGFDGYRGALGQA